MKKDDYIEELQQKLYKIAELSELDEERIAELNIINNQLHIATEEAASANRAKSKFKKQCLRLEQVFQSLWEALVCLF